VDRPTVLVCDDDPTGSQVVRDVALYFGVESLAPAGLRPGTTTFVLTNSRSLDAPQARRVNERIGRLAAPLTDDGGLVVVSRGDSTLRGHLKEETDGLTAGLGAAGRLRRIFCPAYPQAGRVTIDDEHYCVVDGRLVPVAQTPFARDPSFSYRTSNLRRFLVDRGAAGAVDDVVSLSLDGLRAGPDAVAEAVRSAGDRWVVANARSHDDLDVVAAGILRLVEEGLVPLVRSGPSLVRALAGQPAWPALTSSEIRSAFGPRRGHGLVVVGSHVPLATRQLDHLLDRADVAHLEIDVRQVVSADRELLGAAVRRGAELLERSDLVVSTSRQVVPGRDGLDVARRTSAFLSDLTRRIVLERPPAWLVAKGGITSHDLAHRALGVRVARVVGQLLPGQVTLIDPTDGDAVGRHLPYVIFAGNVGQDDGLSHARHLLRKALG
jgi:uncharacterized protein YgbK (DUF1537 family)